MNADQKLAAALAWADCLPDPFNTAGEDHEEWANAKVLAAALRAEKARAERTIPHFATMDEKAGCSYVVVRDINVAKTLELYPGFVNIDIAADGHLRGIELFDPRPAVSAAEAHGLQRAINAIDKRYSYDEIQEEPDKAEWRRGYNAGKDDAEGNIRIVVRSLSERK